MAVVFGGCLLMLILQIFTGPIFTWIIWAMAVAVVSLEYVDHCCIGWKLTPQTQLVSFLTCKLYDLNLTFILSFDLFLFSFSVVSFGTLFCVLEQVQVCIGLFIFSSQMLICMIWLLSWPQCNIPCDSTTTGDQLFMPDFTPSFTRLLFHSFVP